MNPTSSSYDARVELRELAERHRVADAGHDVLSLGVREVVAIGPGLAGRRVPGEADAGARRRAAVAEDHRLHVHSGADVVGDAFLAAVEHGPRGVPGVEDRAEGQVELLSRVLREVASGVLTHQLLVRRHQVAQVLDLERRVVRASPVGLHPAQLRGEHGPVDAEDGAAEHLDQASVGVEGEPLAPVLPQTGHRLVVEAYVEDGLHHPWHRDRGTRANRDQQRVARVAKSTAHPVLEQGQVLGQLGLELRGRGPVGEVGAARSGGDREARRHRQPQPGHLGEVGPLAPEQVGLGPVPVGEVAHVGTHSRIVMPRRRDGKGQRRRIRSRFPASGGHLEGRWAQNRTYRSRSADEPDGPHGSNSIAHSDYSGVLLSQTLRTRRPMEEALLGRN